MVISSQTPESQPNRCRVCGSEIKIEPSALPGDAPCLRCGHLLWFTWEDLGEIEVIRPLENVLRAESLDRFLDSVLIRPGTHIVLDLARVRFFSSAVFSKLINLKRRPGPSADDSVSAMSITTYRRPCGSCTWIMCSMWRRKVAGGWHGPARIVTCLA